MSITRKIAALFAIAENASSSENEAMVALQKALDLLAEHNLSRDDIKSSKDVRVHTLVHKTNKKQVSAFIVSPGLEKLFDVVIYFQRCVDGVSWTFIGEEDDVRAAHAAFVSLTLAKEAEYSKYLKTEAAMIAQHAGTHGKSLRTAFEKAMGGRICQRAKEMTAKREDLRQTTGTALVVCKQQAIKQHMQESDLKLTAEKRSTVIRDRSAFDAGVAAGNRADLGGQNKITA